MIANKETVLDRAIEVLGSREKALDWLTTTSRTLGGKPADIAQRGVAGCEQVLRHLHAVECFQPE